MLSLSAQVDAGRLISASNVGLNSDPEINSGRLNVRKAEYFPQKKPCVNKAFFFDKVTPRVLHSLHLGLFRRLQHQM